MSEITVEQHDRIQKRAVLSVVEYASIANAVMDYLSEMQRNGTEIHPGMMIETTRNTVALYCAEKTREVWAVPTGLNVAGGELPPEYQR
jgi:hypothetical protein